MSKWNLLAIYDALGLDIDGRYITNKDGSLRHDAMGNMRYDIGDAMEWTDLKDEFTWDDIDWMMGWEER
jgi:hypothetical protein